MTHGSKVNSMAIKALKSVYTTDNSMDSHKRAYLQPYGMQAIPVNSMDKLYLVITSHCSFAASTIIRGLLKGVTG